MANLIHTKREELIAFIRKQMEGPGGCNGNYTLASDNWNEEEEVVNTTPGSIYSTGVLFPNKKVVDGGNIASENNDAVFEAPSTSDDIETTLHPLTVMRLMVLSGAMLMMRIYTP